MRIYGRKQEINEGYYEVAYKEYRPDGSLKATGTEDFTRERLKTLEYRFIYTWDGQKRNKGGYRWFELRETALINKDDLKELKKYMIDKYQDSEIVDARNK